MILYLIANILFLISFVWLMLTGVSTAIWGAWIVVWFAVDYAVIWITGYAPPAWAWGLVLSALAILWAGVFFLTGAT